ncbi:Flp pilus assembly protein CpaB [Oceanicola sp. S124]|uniref:Flp pilus assembly protein CpaB n=1 Tax=Oceanicola sp. S124 TaxID=1042378 RepID=UPI000318D0B4|nr:Flp pilus assembly protein CpaB [Oceanicola sp. S124]
MKRLLLVIVTSLLAALAVAWFSISTNGAPIEARAQAPVTPSPAPAPAPAPTVSVLTARSSLAKGAAIPPEALGRLTLADGQLQEGLLQDTPANRQALLALAAPRDIPAGTTFIAADLLPPAPEPVAEPPRPVGYAGLLGTGMRAIAVPVTAETAVAGLISSGDRVDVMISYDTREGLRAVRTILSNVRVIARDRTTGNTSDGTGVPRTITLELDPEGAKILALAMQTGDLMLVLSAPGGGPLPLIIEDAPMLSSRLSGGDAPRAAPATTRVEVFRGNATQRVLTLPDPTAPPASQ